MTLERMVYQDNVLTHKAEVDPETLVGRMLCIQDRANELRGLPAAPAETTPVVLVTEFVGWTAYNSATGATPNNKPTKDLESILKKISEKQGEGFSFAGSAFAWFRTLDDEGNLREVYLSAEELAEVLFTDRWVPNIHDFTYVRILQ